MFNNQTCFESDCFPNTSQFKYYVFSTFYSVTTFNFLYENYFSIFFANAPCNIITPTKSWNRKNRWNSEISLQDIHTASTLFFVLGSMYLELRILNHNKESTMVVWMIWNISITLFLVLLRWILNPFNTNFSLSFWFKSKSMC